MRRRERECLNSFHQPVNKPGSYLSESYVTHWFGKTIKKAEIKDLHFHDLRHIFASWLVMSGIGLITVQQFLGHQTYQMSQKYAHLSPEHQQSAIDILARKTGKLGAKRIESVSNMAQPENLPIFRNTEIVLVQ